MAPDPPSWECALPHTAVQKKSSKRKTFLNSGSARRQSHILRARTKQGISGVLVRGSGLKQLGQEEPAPSKSPRKRRSAPRNQRHARNRHRVQSSHGWHESNPIGTRLGPSQSSIRLKIPIGLAPSQSIAIGLAPSQSITIGLAPSQSNPIQSHPIGPQSNPIQSNRQSNFRLHGSD